MGSDYQTLESKSTKVEILDEWGKKRRVLKKDCIIHLSDDRRHEYGVSYCVLSGTPGEIRKVAAKIARAAGLVVL